MKIESFEERKNPRGALPLSPQSVTEKVVVDREGDHCWALNAASSSATTKFPFMALSLSLKGDGGITRLSVLDSKESVRCFMFVCSFRWTEEHKPISLFKRKKHQLAAYNKKSSWCVWEREKSGVEVREREEGRRMSKVGVGREEENKMKEFCFGVMAKAGKEKKKNALVRKEK